MLDIRTYLTEAVARRSVGKYMDPKMISGITESTNIDGVIKVLSGCASYYGEIDEFNTSQIDTFKGMVGLYERSSIGLVYSTIKSGRERYLLIYYGNDRFLEVRFSNDGKGGILAVLLLKLVGLSPMLTDMYDGRILDAGVVVMKDIIKDSVK
jgi:hypothetical protein